MDVFNDFFVLPFLDIADAPLFFVEVVIGGLSAGVMYSLVALGFVLIFKASGVFNFAQGVLALFAALTLVGITEWGVPFFLALPLTAGVMVILAIAIERLVLRPLVNQEPIILFMSTIGLAFFLEGLGDTLWGSNVKKLDAGIPDASFEMGGILLNQFELFAAALASGLGNLLLVLLVVLPFGLGKLLLVLLVVLGVVLGKLLLVLLLRLNEEELFVGFCLGQQHLRQLFFSSRPASFSRRAGPALSQPLSATAF